MTSSRNLACLVFISCWAVALAAPNKTVFLQSHESQPDNRTLTLQLDEGIAVDAQPGTTCITTRKCKDL